MEQLLRLLRDLSSQLPRRGDCQHRDSLRVRVDAAEHFDGREAESNRLASPGFGSGQNVVASQRRGQRCRLHRRRVRVPQDLPGEAGESVAHREGQLLAVTSAIPRLVSARMFSELNVKSVMYWPIVLDTCQSWAMIITSRSEIAWRPRKAVRRVHLGCWYRPRCGARAQVRRLRAFATALADLLTASAAFAATTTTFATAIAGST